MVQGALERTRQRVTQARGVIAQRVHLPQHPKQAGSLVIVARELDGACQELHGLVQLVASSGKLARASQPGDRAPTNPVELLQLVAPDEIRILGLDRLRVVVRQEGCSLVGAELAGLEPLGERRVQTTSLRLRNRAIRDLARECVLDRVLGVARHRRDAAGDDQVALLEKIEDRVFAAQEMNDRRPPEHTPHDRSGLERGLLDGRKSVDARRENRMDGIRHGEVSVPLS